MNQPGALPRAQHEATDVEPSGTAHPCLLFLAPALRAGRAEVTDCDRLAAAPATTTGSRTGVAPGRRSTARRRSPACTAAVAADAGQRALPLPARARLRRRRRGGKGDRLVPQGRGQELPGRLHQPRLPVRARRWRRRPTRRRRRTGSARRADLGDPTGASQPRDLLRVRHRRARGRLRRGGEALQDRGRRRRCAAMRNLGLFYVNGTGVRAGLRRGAPPLQGARPTSASPSVRSTISASCTTTATASTRTTRRPSRYYRAAADKGLGDGHVQSRLAYEDGEGVEKDLAEALDWFRKSAEAGYRDAYNAVGALLRQRRRGRRRTTPRRRAGT